MFTLGQFLKADFLTWYKILAGNDETLKERPVEHITVIELPVENFVRRNEIVLSSASGCVDDADKMLELISGVYHLEACALILTRPDDKLTLPQNCLEYLKTADLPVVLIPWDCLFADLTEFALEQIRNYNLKELRIYEGIQKQLLSAYLGGKDMNAAAGIIAGSLNTRVDFFDFGGNLKGASYKPTECKILGPDGTDRCLAIKTGDRLYGYLALDAYHMANAALFERYLLQPLILWFDKELVVKYSRQKEKDDFIWEIIKGSTCEKEGLIRNGMLFGFNLRKPYACVVGQVHLDSNQGIEEEEKWVISNIFNMKEQMLEVAKASRKSILLTFQQNYLVFYIEEKAEGSEIGANQYIDKLEEKFAVTFPHVLFSWGICDAKIDPTEFHESYIHAKLAHDMCAAVIRKNVRCSYKNTLISSILSLLENDPKIRKNTLATINPILEYDNQNQAGLLLTLQTYLKLKNVSETARILHLHRQSLIYRLNKIEELTGMSLKDPDNCFLLEIAARMFTKA